MASLTQFAAAAGSANIMELMSPRPGKCLKLGPRWLKFTGPTTSSGMLLSVRRSPFAVDGLSVLSAGHGLNDDRQTACSSPLKIGASS